MPGSGSQSRAFTGCQDQLLVLLLFCFYFYISLYYLRKKILSVVDTACYICFRRATSFLLASPLPPSPCSPPPTPHRLPSLIGELVFLPHFLLWGHRWLFFKLFLPYLGENLLNMKFNHINHLKVPNSVPYRIFTKLWACHHYVNSTFLLWPFRPVGGMEWVSLIKINRSFSVRRHSRFGVNPLFCIFYL